MLISAGRVSVDGVVAELGARADPDEQLITVDGKALSPPEYLYWMAHKARGVVTTRHDPGGRRTIMECLPASLQTLYPVGRLDRDTEGLVLFTNDGDTAHILLHPSRGNEREYQVVVRGVVSGEDLRRLATGLPLRDGHTAPAKVSQVKRARNEAETRFHLTLQQGKKRQIRRSMAYLGHPVIRLVRTRFGNLELGDLARGKARALHGAERRRLLRHAAKLEAGHRGAQGDTARRRPKA